MDSPTQFGGDGVGSPTNVAWVWNSSNVAAFIAAEYVYGPISTYSPPGRFTHEAAIPSVRGNSRRELPPLFARRSTIRRSTLAESTKRRSRVANCARDSSAAFTTELKAK